MCGFMCKYSTSDREAMKLCIGQLNYTHMPKMHVCKKLQNFLSPLPLVSIVTVSL